VQSHKFAVGCGTTWGRTKGAHVVWGCFKFTPSYFGISKHISDREIFWPQKPGWCSLEASRATHHLCTTVHISSKLKAARQKIEQQIEQKIEQA
jgi:hypothetical protein